MKIFKFIEASIEKAVFSARPVIAVLVLFISILFAFKAALLQPNTSFEKLVPTNHPYITNFFAHKDDLTNANVVSIVVQNKDGDIFDADYLQKLRKISDEVFLIPGVDRARMLSLWSSNLRWLSTSDEGWNGGAIIENDYRGKPQHLEKIKKNILNSQEIGRLVANDFQSSIISVPLLEINAKTNKPIDYQEFSSHLNKIRDKYQDDKVAIYITGFAKLVGDLIDGIINIAFFFLFAILITFVLLYFYSRCWSSTILPIFCSLLAVIIQLGIGQWIGFGLDPFSILVPFLTFAIGVSHAVQMVNQIAIETSAGANKYQASRLAFRHLFAAGAAALMSDCAGFLTLLFIDVGVIRELAISASIGIAAIIIMNIIFLPVLMSYFGVSKRGLAHNADKETNLAKWPVLVAQCANRAMAKKLLVTFLLVVVASLYLARDLKIGDVDAGAPELRVDSQYNKDVRFLNAHYSVSSDVLVVMAKTAPENCQSFRVLNKIEELEWQLSQFDSVQFTVSQAKLAKQSVVLLNEGFIKWYGVQASQNIIDQNLGVIGKSPFSNAKCSMSTIAIFLEDHKAETLEEITSFVQRFIDQNNDDEVEFLLAAGSAGIQAATNQVVEESQNKMLIFVYLVVAVMVFLTFGYWQALVAILLPLVITSFISQAIMAQLGIGITVSTLPVIALGVGIGVDYGIYIYSKFEYYLKQGHDFFPAYTLALRTTGKAVIFTAITLAVGTGTWIFSDIKSQADMGILLTFMFVWNMLGALILLPALARLLINDNKLAQLRARSVAGKNKTSGSPSNEFSPVGNATSP